ncbi:hypothetical protein EPUS_03039 [Endocarpon pusillum Z07020]|uniref:Peptidoglycan binding-like domain-containing protein n=1 Tax=Endocarpon pusillum (strain Z07020 / HMAS-L-300199) TaxID=1263415 RepID=U1GLV2_ENDPU|nr:uncharacterized protein EPUS_03039 [Endocarpon pusillum Z07020]ERF73198.1 hypothetical protein EPUS_03039 [Endocarpon pusillum Z07020]
MPFTATSVLLSIAALLFYCLHVDAAPGYCNGESLKRGCQRIGLDGFFQYTFAARVPVYASGSTFAEDCMMNNGAEGKGVKALQYSLNNCYTSKPQDKLEEDGKYGSLTKAAVKAAQKRIGADQDGIYGPETKSKMSWYGKGLSYPENRCFLYKYTLGGCLR